MMIEAIDSSVLKVTFTKVNGEERIMTCTTNLQLIPEYARPKTEGDISDKESPVQRAFDLNKNEWRSFRKENVKSVEIICPWDLWTNGES